MSVQQPASELHSLYQKALREYLEDGGEAPLHQAYELGRHALGSGIGLLGIAQVHQAAVAEVLKRGSEPTGELARKLSAAGRFLMESLSPFEMLHLGNQEANAALRRLNVILEEEAKRIAHTLHDEAAQLLASAYLELAEISRENPSLGIQQRLERITLQLDQVREQLRRLSHELRPPILDQLGLMPALQFLADGFRKRSPLHVEIENRTREGGRFPQVIETTIYRVVQEALNNVIRHAHASHVVVRVWSEESMLHCSIRDDGAGFDPVSSGDHATQGLGLLGIRERISSLYGSFKLDSGTGSGTELRISIPLGKET